MKQMPSLPFSTRPEPIVALVELGACRPAGDPAVDDDSAGITHMAGDDARPSVEELEEISVIAFVQTTETLQAHQPTRSGQ